MTTQVVHTPHGDRFLSEFLAKSSTRGLTGSHIPYSLKNTPKETSLASPLTLRTQRATPAKHVRKNAVGNLSETRRVERDASGATGCLLTGDGHLVHSLGDSAMTRHASWLAVLAAWALVGGTATGGLTAYWTFDTDYSSSVNNATMQGTPQGNVSITGVPGEFKVGAGGLKIDSTTTGAHNVHISNPVAVAADSPIITITAWYNYTDISGNGSDARNFVWESNPNYSVSFALNTASGVKDAEWFYLTQPSTSISDNSGPVVAPGTWNHVAMVWNPETQRIKFYHNGELRDYRSFPAGALLVDMAGLYIGDYRSGNGDRNFDGYIDDMAVLDHEPSPEAIAGLASGLYTPATMPADTASPLGMRVLDPMWGLTDKIVFDNPGGLAVSPVDGKLYAGRRNTLATDGGIYRIESDGSATLVAAGDRPAALAIDPDDGDIFFSEDYGRFPAPISGEIYRIAAGDGAAVAWVNGFDNDTIDDDPVGLAIVPNTFNGGAGSLVHPGDAMSVDRGSGGFEQVWLWSPDVSDVDNEGSIKQVLHADSDLADGVGSPLVDPSDIAVTDTTIYVADMGANKLYTLDPTSGALAELVTSRTIGSPSALAVDPVTGDLIVLSDADSTPAVLLRVDVTTGEVSVLADTLLDAPGWANLAFSPDGSRLYVGEQGGDAIYELTRVPEPGAATLLAMLLAAGLAWWRRRE
jgi:hypothetical protein